MSGASPAEVGRAPLRLALEGLTVDLARRRVVEDVDLTLGAGTLTGLIGPNGAGKSTLMRAALGLIAPNAGRVLIGGAEARAMEPGARALAAAYLPQEREIGWPVSVRSLVALGRMPHRWAGAPESADDVAAVEAAMARLEVLSLAERRALSLSGGERARVLIARALAQAAPMLLADEPTAGLDPAHQIAVMGLLHGLAAEGHTVLVSVHDLGLAARWCDRLVMMDGGRLVADGPVRAVLTPERLAAVYGISAHLDWSQGAPIVLPLDRVG